MGGRTRKLRRGWGFSSDVGALERELNAIYNPYGVSLTVKTDNSIEGNMEWDDRAVGADKGDGMMNLSGSGFFSSETAEMKALRKLYQNRNKKYDKHAYYIFILNEAIATDQPKSVVQGDMPRGKQFGYIFTSAVASESMAWLIAHELGHGMFTLEHSFNINYSGPAYQGKTDNLMDYPASPSTHGGAHLAAFQWNVMANPAALTWFDSEEDGMAKAETPYVRLLLHGGARNAGDNSSFYFASVNVKNDYGNDGVMIHKSVDSAKAIINLINAQKDNSIQSLDIFSHGNSSGLYMIKGASTSKYISEDEMNENNLYAPLYLNSSAKNIEMLGTLFSGDYRLSEDRGYISDISLAKFTNSCKIEIHGCNTANNYPVWGGMCKDLSEMLHKAGKTRAVVIGHSTKANPNINGVETTNKGQDYRHGERVIFHNGEVIMITTKQGRITAPEIDAALKGLLK